MILIQGELPGIIKKQKSIPLTQRDIESLRWIGEMYAVRFDSVVKILGRRAGEAKVGDRVIRPVREGYIHVMNARKVVKKWQRAGLIEYKRVFFDEPGYIWLTKKGLRQVGLEYPYLEPSIYTLTHFHLVNEVRLWEEAREKYKGRLRWKSERQLRRELLLQHGVKYKDFHVPDGEVFIRQEDGKEARIAIEIETTSKTYQRLAVILLKFARVDYEAVWYFVNDVTGPVMKKALAKVKGEIDTSSFHVMHLREVLQDGDHSNGNQ